ncbi:HK97 gp10 family phage protein [Granulicella tundricola]|uniref:Phage protein, HK97 gp10 family n=1 Tax=Granulicella tundricola (strain ATCC BAA-1859 / DSM 23138 / MP5ACTX9) TaxID=1198114 RepID=E8X0R4_GRATM|nr:HK97 gp10 family phage protein [Granulicella tundricola]ADW69015.1 phage protein, HK97 gp10 family [Granulicella tundricola MP5ACTX9]
MADGFSADIKGIAEVKALFEALSTKEADNAILKALKAGALIEQAAISDRAPVKDTTGGLLPEGALKADIEVKVHRPSGRTPYVTVAPGKYTAHVARWLEYGHRLVRGGYSRMLKNGKTRGPGKEVGFVAEHSFIRVGYEESREAVVEAISNTLVAEIQKAAVKKQ